MSLLLAPILVNVASKRRKLAPENDWFVADVTSRGDFKILSPFEPHGDIPVPGTSLVTDSVEGAWQGLKRIKGELDMSRLKGKGRKRKGLPSCHLLGDQELSYGEARRELYVPMYEWTLKNVEKVKEALKTLREKAEGKKGLLLLDYDTNGNIEDFKRPLSHASLIAKWMREGRDLEV